MKGSRAYKTIFILTIFIGLDSGELPDEAATM